MHYLAYFTFVLLGAAGTVHGVALPFLIEKFELSLSSAGLLLATHFFGHLLASLAYPHLNRKRDPLQLIAFSFVIVAISFIALPFSPFWFVLIIFAFLASLGLGTADVGFNAIISGYEPVEAQRVMSWLHFSFAIGALFSPFLFSFLLGTRFSWPILYYLFSFFSAFFIYFMRPDLKKKPIQAETTSVQEDTGQVLRQPAYWFLLATMFLYTGTEIALAGWIPTLLTTMGMAAKHASLGVSALWLGITIGRALSARVSGKISPRRLLSILAPASALMLVPFIWPLPLWALLLLIFGTGLFFSSIVPLILLEGTILFPGFADVTTSGIMVAGALGGVIGPAALGVIGEYFSLSKGIFTLAGVMFVNTVFILLLPSSSPLKLAPGQTTGTKETD